MVRKGQGCHVWLPGLCRVQFQDNPGKVKVSSDPRISCLCGKGVWNLELCSLYCRVADTCV